MKRKRIIAGAVLLVFISSMLTFYLTRLIPLAYGEAVIIPREEYELMQQYSKLFQVKNILTNDYVDKIDQSKLVDGSIKGLASSLGDPYTVYMDKKDYQDFTTQTTGSYAGVGIVVSVDNDGHIVVVSPMKGTPGEKAGIKSGDIIVSVDNVKVNGNNLDKAVSLMKGPQGTKVSLVLMRDNKLINKTLTREIIKLQTVSSTMLPNKIGYIKMTMFDENTSADFTKALNNLKTQGLNGLIIDLRDNPGGILEQCVNVADELLPKGLIVSTKGRNKKDNQVIYAKGPGLQKPIAVLVNGGSASASEILAGAIKDRKVGVLVGTKTFGKGLVQSVIDFGDGTALKYTSARYYTPNGVNIQGKGIEPNYVVELPKNYVVTDTPDLKGDTQLIKAYDIIKSEIK
ncbi:S41 family peptidase [Thermoanaerobacterium butyriciformans]|uniref:Carboxyl-terminal processing protease n=1 Tax=Thermoanaerobacterium butyriciformans TaxID=1702242 RepID=A0ABS4NCT7_9THEO|nr:S41 family peptidase [Thermoanaerobacterium butyriciformans]MBP2071014.1 carboxyl-terminal processing protease [Thermoanaerobacterium butyriciformans]MDK2805049.1 carboxyl-terminal processing protease [Thermoanaerobacterium sp.]